MIELCALASGSNGNCYYIGNKHEAILVDAGISTRRIISRMHQQNLDPAKVKAVFISHEHADHIRGARVLSKRLKIPVYLTRKTYAGMYPVYQPAAPRFFRPGSDVNAGSFVIHTFRKNHDAIEPCSFRIEHNGFSIGVFTDIGNPSDHMVSHLNKCHALFLETNYDDKMLREGSYPWPLKKRIASEQGHLSNVQAFELLQNHSGSQLELILLSHLSAENNTPETAMKCFRTLEDKYRIRLTSRHAPGEVFIVE